MTTRSVSKEDVVLSIGDTINLFATDSTRDNSGGGAQFSPNPSPQSQIFSVTQDVDDRLGR